MALYPEVCLEVLKWDGHPVWVKDPEGHRDLGPLAVEPADSHVNGLNGRRPAHACRASTPDQQKQGKRQQESTFLKRIHHDFSMA